MEKEKRASNRWSGQLQSIRGSSDFENESVTKSNRDSMDIESTTSSDDAPPPLPVKTREADYSNLPDVPQEVQLRRKMTSDRSSSQHSKVKMKLPEPVDNASQNNPPTPPPKPKRSPAHSHSTCNRPSDLSDNMTEVNDNNNAVKMRN